MGFQWFRYRIPRNCSKTLNFFTLKGGAIAPLAIFPSLGASLVGSSDFFLFERDFESINHNKMITTFLKVKEFTLLFYIESSDPEQSRRLKGGETAVVDFFRAGVGGTWAKNLEAGVEARTTFLKFWNGCWKDLNQKSWNLSASRRDHQIPFLRIPAWHSLFSRAKKG